LAARDAVSSDAASSGAAAAELRLVPITRSGAPAEALGELPALAADACAATARLYLTAGFVPPWTGYLAVRGAVRGAVREAGPEREVVGTCAFTSPPKDGRVELAYFTFPAFEGRGIATRMARELLAIAARAEPGVLVIAHTLPEENASTTILKRLGFMLAGPVEHPEDGTVWEWRR
jgi:hypothetical protein